MATALNLAAVPDAAIFAVAGGALLSWLGLGVIWLRQTRIRRVQEAILGPSGNADLVTHAANLLDSVQRQTGEWQDLSSRLQLRMGAIEGVLSEVFSRHALVRYDAYGEQTGQQSSSLALLNVSGDGLIITSIASRDQARMYVRKISGGQPEHKLAPEEIEALEIALAAGPLGIDGSIGGIASEPIAATRLGEAELDVGSCAGPQRHI